MRKLIWGLFLISTIPLLLAQQSSPPALPTNLYTTPPTTGVQLGNPNTWTAAQTFNVPFNSYNGLALVGQGIPLVRSNVALVAQNAAITTTNLLANLPASARFRVSYYAVISSAFTTAGLTVTIGWTDNVQAQTSVSAVSGTAQGSIIQGTVFIAAIGATNITYATASTGTFGAYTVAIIVEQLT